MVTMEEKIVDSKIEDHFRVIEFKLRNSFQAIKKDNDLIKAKISELNGLFDRSNFKKISVEFQKLKKEVSESLDKIRKENKEDISKFAQAELRPIKESLSKLDKKNIKKSLQKEISYLLDKKVDSKFDTFKKRTEQIRKELNSLVKEGSESIKDLSDKQKSFVIRANKDVKSDLNLTRTSFRSELDSQRTQIEETQKKLNDQIENLNKLIQDERDYALNNIKSNIKSVETSRKEEINKINRQIGYIKGRLNSLGLKDSKVGQKTFFNSIISSLSDGDSVIVEKKAKKLPTSQKKQKTFMSKIVDSLSD